MQSPVSFHVTARETIHLAIECSQKDRQAVEQHLATYFKDLAVLPEPVPALGEPYQTLWAVPNLPALPLQSDFKFDPYGQLFAAFGQLPPQAFASLRVFFAPVENKPFQDLIKELEQEERQQVSYKNKEAAAVTRQRIRDIEKKLPFWRVALQFISNDARWLQNISTFLSQYQSGEAGFTTDKNLKSHPFVDASFPPVWGYCSTEELANFAHFPGKEVATDLLETASMKSKLPPESYTKDGIRIGTSEARGQTKPVCIPLSVRDRHLYIVGKSGTGKSTLIYNAIAQDIYNGSGVAVIDPHGDLVEDVLRCIPEERVEDTIYFNAADKQFPIGLNMFNAETEDEIGLLADDLLVTFKRLSESWGERLDTILRYTFHTLLRAEDASFLDIQRLLQNDNFRKRTLTQIKEPLLLEFWHNLFTQYPKDAMQPILNRMTKFALSPTLAGILGQANAMLSFFDVIQNRKILLVNLSKGRIGEDTAQLLGSLIVSQIQLAIMRRAEMPKELREPYFLYVDEFQNFTTSAFEKILSEARKYKLCLTLAHQYISQLDEKTKNAILANVGTIIMFQSYPQDAQALRPELGQYEPTDVTNLNTALHEALCKPATQSKDTFKFQTMAPLKFSESYVDRIVAYTRENYATPVAPKEKESATPPPDAADVPRPTRPAKAIPKEFANSGDRIAHYVSLASYLTQNQIERICFAHNAENSRPAAASRALKNLVENKKIKIQKFGKENIYYLGRTCNPTGHNVAVRDLFAKILLSDFAVGSVSFFSSLGGLNPDLAVEFLADDGALIKTFWEYDTGSENVTELISKVQRYATYMSTSAGASGGTLGGIIFVFNSEERLQQVSRTITDPNIIAAVLTQFNTLHDPAFRSLGSQNSAPLFKE